MNVGQFSTIYKRCFQNKQDYKSYISIIELFEVIGFETKIKIQVNFKYI